MVRKAPPLQVVMAPDWRKDNPYLELLAKSLADQGASIGFADMPVGLFALTRLRSSKPDIRVLHLHWVNGLIDPVLWSPHEWIRHIKLALLVADVICTRTLGTRIVWTIHNVVAHESATPEAELSVRATLARWVSHTIVHSPSALAAIRSLYGSDSLPSAKTTVIRHGNYFGCYPPNAKSTAQLRSDWGLNSSHIIVLFFGNVRPYKGIERLLAALRMTTRDDLRVVVAGKPMSEAMRMTLEHFANNDPRVLLALQFIPDSDVAAYFEIADVVAIPFERTLTSGSAVLAMTQGKAMILPEDARILDLGGDESALYFRDNDDLARTLSALQKQPLEQMGARNRRDAERFDWQRVGELTLSCYQRNRPIDGMRAINDGAESTRRQRNRMNIKHTKIVKAWLTNRMAMVISFGVRRTRRVAIRRFLIESIFERYFGWRRLDLVGKTAFGAKMHLSLPDSIQTSIFLTGRWEPQISGIVSATLLPGDVFIDIGANVGYYTLLAAQLVGDSGKVYSFEASPTIYGHLRQNVALNGIGNAQMFNVAVSSGLGEVSIWSAPEGNQGHSTIIESVARADGHHLEAVVPCDALPNLLPLDDLLSARLIKIDIEGAERLAIEGVVDVLSEFSKRTEWLVELSPAFSPGGSADTDWVFHAFVDAGYSAYRVENNYGSLVDEAGASMRALVRLNMPPRERLNDVLFTKLTSQF